MITDPYLTYEDQAHLTGHLAQPATLSQWRRWLAQHGISPDDATIDGQWAVCSFIDEGQAVAALETVEACPAP